MNATAPSEAHVKMRLRVYSMTPEGVITEDHGTVAEVRHGEDAEPQGLGFFQMPPCACPRHRTTERVSSPTGPLHVATMRATVRRLLAEDAELPTREELTTLRLLLRGHLMLLIPEVAGAARRLPEDEAPRECALAGVREARMRLASEPGPTLPAAVAHAQRLAHAVGALCDHYETLAAPR
ncbi:MAG TPA: DUF6415 family natural product biosynthesis protein [Streptomyces sp.]|nr:DUF6415 family natural product biosynthesis protein [Streptomyces sp.]